MTQSAQSTGKSIRRQSVDKGLDPAVLRVASYEENVSPKFQPMR